MRTLGHRAIERRSRLRPHRGIDFVLNADGFGTAAAKVGTYGRVTRGRGVFATGFKLFLVEDSGLMSPAQVLRLRPRPVLAPKQDYGVVVVEPGELGVVPAEGAPVDLDDVRVVMGARQHLRDDPALLGHLQALVDACLLDGGRHVVRSVAPK